MDSEFPQNPSFALKPDTWRIDRVVLLPTEGSARVFFETVYPLFCDCVVASADRAYPRNAELNHALFEALANDASTKVIVFNLSCLRDLKLKTERIWVLDDLLMQDFKRHPVERELRLSLSPEKLAFLMESFFGQWAKMDRVHNVGFAYANYREYQRENFDWRTALLGVPDQAN